MRKHYLLIAFILAFIVTVAGCGGGPAGREDASGAGPATAEAGAAKGKIYECDRFTITIPDKWEYMEVDGGIQIYKMSGEAIQVAYRGYNMNDTEAETQTRGMAERYGGTDAKEAELLGKTFWTTTYTPDGGIYQTHYLCMEDGEMLSIVCAGRDHETDPVFADTLDSIVFK